MHANGVSYVTGGIGAEERQAVHRVRGKYNVDISLRTPCGRAHVSPLVIEDANGNRLVDEAAAGPSLLAQLPPGKYTARLAPADGAAVVKTFTVPANGRIQLTIQAPAIDRSFAGDALISW